MLAHPHPRPRSDVRIIDTAQLPVTIVCQLSLHERFLDKPTIRERVDRAVGKRDAVIGDRMAGALEDRQPAEHGGGKPHAVQSTSPVRLTSTDEIVDDLIRVPPDSRELRPVTNRRSDAMIYVDRDQGSTNRFAQQCLTVSACANETDAP